MMWASHFRMKMDAVPGHTNYHVVHTKVHDKANERKNG